MPPMTAFRLFALLQFSLLLMPFTVQAKGLQELKPAAVLPPDTAGSQWAAKQAEHVYGLPEIKPHKKGTLTLSADSLTFVEKNGSTTIPKKMITAVSVGNQRVEMWGMTGRIIRMAIPDNCGLAVAAVAHHRIDMLTVEFSDSRGGSHSAVFFLGANQAADAIKSFALQPKAARIAATPGCGGSFTEQGSMLIATPNWNGAEVPAVYQGLVYEHLMDRFRKAKNVTKVYREGENLAEGVCPQYTVHLSVTGFKEGSSVKRAMYGPVGMFVGTTQMVFDADLSDRLGSIAIKEQVKTTMRGEGESTNVADHVAKSLVKKYEKAVKANEKKTGVSSDAPKA